MNCRIQVKALWLEDKPGFFITAGIALYIFGVFFSVTIGEGGLFLGIAAMLEDARRKKTLGSLLPALRANPLATPWALYLGAGVVASIFAVYPLKSFGYLPSDIIKYLAFSFMCLALKGRRFSTASAVYLGGAVIAACIGISQALTGLFSGQDVRAHAFMHPVTFGEMMCLALTFAVAWLLEGNKRKWSAAVAVAGLFIFAALALTQTRGAYLGFAAGFAAIFLLDKGSRKNSLPIIAVLLILSAAAALTNPSVRYKLGSIPKGIIKAVFAVEKNNPDIKNHIPDVAINIRIELWKIGIRIFKDHPLTGVGPTNVGRVYTLYYKDMMGGQGAWGSLHNLYLHQLAERGIVGLAALLYLFSAMFAGALKRLRECRNVYTLWAVAALPAFFVINFTQISFQHFNPSFALFLALAFSFNAQTSGKEIS